MASDQEPDPPPPPDAMSWERAISRPPVLNDQTPSLPYWVRPFAKPEIEHMAALRPKFVVVAKVAAPYSLIVSLVINALLGVPWRHMMFTVPASTIIGLLLMIVSFGVIELLGWLSGYRPALVTWTLSEEHSGEALARALEQAAAASGFVVVWSKDHTFVATRNVGQQRGLVRASDGPRRLSLLPSRRASTRTLKVAVHGTCIWETGETEELAALARNIVRDAAAHEPWIAQSASSSTTGA